MAIPEGLLCPITGMLMHEPVICMDGWSYERLAIEAWLFGSYALFYLAVPAMDNPCRACAGRHQHRSPMTGKKLPRTDLIPNVLLSKACQEYAAMHSDAIHSQGPRLAALSSRLQQLAHVLPHPQWEPQLCRTSAQHCAADGISDKSALSSQLSQRAAAAQSQPAAQPAHVQPAQVQADHAAAPAAAAAGAAASASASSDDATSIVISCVTSVDAVEFKCTQVGLGPDKRLVWSVHNKHPAGRTISATLSWVPDGGATSAADGSLRSTRHNYFMPAAPLTLLVQAHETREVYSSRPVKPEKGFASTGREWQYKWSSVRSK